ncbi:Hsp20/alpha crystallin family protein [Fischerella sp. PCC 9605]|uniref:Hsp20/alpha crystallin family protein n=1 Tax=Fischerella sp. PCC 9605 TaxID=1173024 RepID=UPI000478F12D|nr:Hsp20/alpha crystallin family protein [Fischerella sp. PCC 9605]
MALIRWQPFQEIEMLRRQFDDLFSEFNELTGFSRESRRTWIPAIELRETDESLILRAELPGVEGKDLNIQASRESVLISGEHHYDSKAEDQGYFRSEFHYGRFERQIPLPMPIQPDKVQAEFKNGILTLMLAKAEEVRRRVVKINVTEGNGHQAIAGTESAKTVDVTSEPVAS